MASSKEITLQMLEGKPPIAQARLIYEKGTPQSRELVLILEDRWLDFTPQHQLFQMMEDSKVNRYGRTPREFYGSFDTLVREALFESSKRLAERCQDFTEAIGENARKLTGIPIDKRKVAQQNSLRLLADSEQYLLNICDYARYPLMKFLVAEVGQDESDIKPLVASALAWYCVKETNRILGGNYESVTSDDHVISLKKHAERLRQTTSFCAEHSGKRVANFQSVKTYAHEMIKDGDGKDVSYQTILSLLKDI